MSTRLFVHPRAERELADAASTYEATRAGYGRLFLIDVDHAVTLMLAAPRLYPVVYRELRRAVLRRFPFNLYYLHQPDDHTVQLVACLPGRADPTAMLERLTQRTG